MGVGRTPAPPGIVVAAFDGFVYGMDESPTPIARKAGLRCYNLATGELKWSAKGVEAAPREAGQKRWISANPFTIAGGRMISYVVAATWSSLDSRRAGQEP